VGVGGSTPYGLLKTHNTARRQNPEDLGLNLHRREILKSHILPVDLKSQNNRYKTAYGNTRFIYGNNNKVIRWSYTRVESCSEE
jgi:hypothetical protein